MNNETKTVTLKSKWDNRKRYTFKERMGFSRDDYILIGAVLVIWFLVSVF